MKHTITIKPGSAEIDAKRVLKTISDDYREFKRELLVKITDKKETRREAQNRLLWMWHSELAKHIEIHQGEIYDTEDLHDYVVGKLLPKRVINILGEPEIKRTQTSKMKVKPFADFLTRYEMWTASKYECYFTQPQDLYWQAIMKDAA